MAEIIYVISSKVVNNKILFGCIIKPILSSRSPDYPGHKATMDMSDLAYFAHSGSIVIVVLPNRDLALRESYASSIHGSFSPKFKTDGR